MIYMIKISVNVVNLNTYNRFSANISFFINRRTLLDSIKTVNKEQNISTQPVVSV